MIEVITGCMFSGKTEELIRRLNRCVIAGKKTIIFKPMIDNRYGQCEVISHSGFEFGAISVKESLEILYKFSDYDVVGVDEAQFFDHWLPDICRAMSNAGKRVIVNGLDMDYKRRPFGSMPILLAIADKVDKLKAVCYYCGGDAGYSHRISDSSETIEVGVTDKYRATCGVCNELEVKSIGPCERVSLEACGLIREEDYKRKIERILPKDWIDGDENHV